MGRKTLGVIGGSGFYKIKGLEPVETIELNTPFGKPSDVYYRTHFGETTIIFLARHGQGHHLLPSEVNYRANIFGMKLLGVEYLLSVSAVGSLREEFAPGDFVIVNQFVDRTLRRQSTFFGGGIVAHVSLADPVCSGFSDLVTRAAQGCSPRVHQGGTYICIEGPQFSTRAESELYRTLKADVIGMTAAPEMRLAREAEMCYAVLAMVTDYDCWHQEHKEVEIGDVLRVLKQNVTTAQEIIRNLAEKLATATWECKCNSSLKDAIITEPSVIPAQVREQLRPLLTKYF